MSNRVAHFEIQAENPENCAKFYADVFGWEFKKWEGGSMEYWMVMTGKSDEPGGINGGLMRRNGPGPLEGAGTNAFVCTIVVDNYDDMAAKIVDRGGFETVAKAAIPGMAWQGYFKDVEGNIFGLHQADTNAK
jgi:predicted enzyme related to lactoylglutathione lyase